MFYAQHGEDQYLKKLVGDKTEGFYIDIGAWHPHIDSVTRHFYDLGWEGINIEPVHYYAELLREHRARDFTFEAVVSDQFGTVGVYEIANTGLSTMKHDVAESSGHNSCVIMVPSLTLSYLFENFILEDQVVDFLKIDVEGAEELVLAGNDWSKHRPRILCIEATYPLSSEPNWQSWLSFLLDREYALIHFDGLNLWFYDCREDWPSSLTVNR